MSDNGKNEIEKEIRSRLKNVFGKGPESIGISYGDETIVVVISGYLTKVEKLRMEESGGVQTIRDFRYSKMKKETEEILRQEKFDDLAFGNSFIDVCVKEDKACIVVFVKK